LLLNFKSHDGSLPLEVADVIPPSMLITLAFFNSVAGLMPPSNIPDFPVEVTSGSLLRFPLGPNTSMTLPAFSSGLGVIA